MWPYDFTKENYSKLGYLCEGVTTYMGDLFLLKSGVFKLKDYFLELNDQLQKHFDNFARFNYSVAESSWDTWLDGYVPGAPNRKVSIYTEGCLLALVTDVFIMRNSKEKYNLDDVMKRLYFDYYLNGKGVSEKDYQNVVEQVANASFQEILDNYFYGSKPFEAIIVDAFEYLGLELIHKASPKYSYAKLGFKSIPQGQNFIVKAIYPGSPAEMGGLMLEDEIIAKLDKTQLIRVITNLVKNAIQAIPEEQEKKSVFVTVFREDNQVKIAVKDNGKGISEENAIRIFEPKFTTKSSGMGLGL
eukprot:gene21848-42006_t